ncbi:uncharacterized protein LOC131942993 [Physella acuta]|uniref:uncharacterized protein LOC131942993 n=1 Tax=Physella acuta TaxID=109671 RepID=UPI0027DBB51E|nr:uncharacterized protein LOC131942993 [Physella acuta]
MPAFRGGKNADLFHSAPAAIESPTEEDETEKNKEPVDEGTLRKVYITPLKTETKAVVKEVDPSVVVSDLDEVFALGYIPLDRFQKKLQSLLKKAQESNVHFKTIDFGKDGYVTDAVIKSLFDTLGKNALSKVTKVSLEGCSIITDVGLHWLAKGLSENKHSIQVNINGCSKVTDGGLVTLINAANIGHIEAMATAVSHIREGGNTKGCPLLMDPKKFYSQTQKESYLVVVPMATKLSLSNYLIYKSKKERQPVEHTQNLHLSDWNVNVMEMERNHILFEYVLPPNPVHVIIPFDASADIKDLKGQVIETIAHVLSKEQLNPKQNIKNRKLLVGSSGFFEITYWSKCNLSLDGTLSNTSDNQNVIGFVASQRTLSRTNNYFEVQCLTSQLESGLVIGITYDVVASERFPLEVNETNGGCVEGFETEESVTYGFGIKGTWLSEYVPGDDCVFYITKGGIETKTMPEKPQTGMYPFVSVIGKNVGCTVKLLNMACPPEGLQGQWYDKKQYWTPGFRHNILCDDRGIASYVDTYSSSDERGVLLFQEQITREHNTFTIKVIERGANGVISMGFGTEDYPTNRHPGWEKHSVGYHADDGLYSLQLGGLRDIPIVVTANVPSNLCSSF